MLRLRTRVPVDTQFRPAWWARTGLLQTIAGQRGRAPRPAFRTEVWPTPDDDELRLHFVDVVDETVPTVLLLHGLEGGRDSAYVAEAAAETAARGWRFCVLEFRVGFFRCHNVISLSCYHSGWHLFWTIFEQQHVVCNTEWTWPGRPRIS